MSDMMNINTASNALSYSHAIQDDKDITDNNTGLSIQDKQKIIEAAVVSTAAVIGSLTAANVAAAASVALRTPDPINVADGATIKTALQALSSQDFNQALDKAAAQEKPRFDVSNISMSDRVNLLVNLIALVMDFKTAERSNQSDMAILKGQAAEMTSDAIKASGQTALNGAVGQASLGFAMGGAGFGMNQKALTRERTKLQTTAVDISQTKAAINTDKLNLAKSNDTSLGANAAAGPSKLKFTDGSVKDTKANSVDVTPRQKAIIEEAALPAKDAKLAKQQNNYQEEMNKIEQTKTKAMFINQMNNPVTGVVAGHTQFAQANEQALQNMSQQVTQAAGSMEDSDKSSANDSGNLIESLLQKLDQLIRNGHDLNGMIASSRTS
ncbi:IpaC/SipC family type III secretion system effector [Acerihabitans sp. TG2]|uniref:IpaC/SipC family type III secretion system effector n=1 Tax=Acerihabitans sp. TG2 TaxID=3096008 RepID=UPI002B2302CC|nr:IpaC/SipC family type III secretion system effector [Acerihabitans sp. TG2]MEA9389635.1 IpaC/SipC family type III secretion system effector [Acerihabitans sp. TG2]